MKKLLQVARTSMYPESREYIFLSNYRLHQLGSTLAFFLTLAASAATVHVAPTGSSVPPYDSWDTAATNIQEAVNAATEGDTVLVAAGTYAILKPITITNGIVVLGEAGAVDTIVQGAYSGRCFTVIHSNAVVDGFTIRGGRASSIFTDAKDPNDNNGGGMLLDRGIVRNCIFRDNISHDIGGGLFGNWGTAENCYFISNSAYYGGGCGGSNTVLLNCVLVQNYAHQNGGGVNLSGGIASAVWNCTITDNTAIHEGGGIAIGGDNPIVENSIVYGNTALNGPNYFGVDSSGRFLHSCTYPSTNAIGNISNNPEFVNPSEGDYRLKAGSPCIDAGTNTPLAEATTDIVGVKRIFNNRVDIGAYEASIKSAGLSFSDELETTWDVVVNAKCQLQRTMDITSPNWVNLGGVVTATQARITLIDTNNVPGQVYRLLWLH